MEPKQTCAQWMSEYLDGLPSPTVARKDLLWIAAQAGYSEVTVDRAARALGLSKARVGPTAIAYHKPGAAPLPKQDAEFVLICALDDSVMDFRDVYGDCARQGYGKTSVDAAAWRLGVIIGRRRHDRRIRTMKLPASFDFMYSDWRKRNGYASEESS